MAKATLTKEVIVTCPNKIGTMGKVTTAFAEAKINIEACCCYTMEGTCNFHFVTADVAKTADVCKKSGWACKENLVVCCELTNKVGTLAETTTKLAQAGVDIDYCYCSTGNGTTTKTYFSTKDNNKCLKTLG